MNGTVDASYALEQWMAYGKATNEKLSGALAAYSELQACLGAETRRADQLDSKLRSSAKDVLSLTSKLELKTGELDRARATILDGADRIRVLETRPFLGDQLEALKVDFQRAKTTIEEMGREKELLCGSVGNAMVVELTQKLEERDRELDLARESLKTEKERGFTFARQFIEDIRVRVHRKLTGDVDMNLEKELLAGSIENEMMVELTKHIDELNRELDQARESLKNEKERGFTLSHQVEDNRVEASRYAELEEKFDRLQREHADCMAFSMATGTGENAMTGFEPKRTRMQTRSQRKKSG